MKKLLKVLGIVVGSLVVLVAAAALFIQLRGIPNYEPQKLAVKIDYTPERVERGRKLGTLLCAGCHLDEKTGKLTGHRMADMPPEFGTVFSRNMTQDPTHGIGTWTDGELVYFLRTGVTRDGRFNPVMGGYSHMSDEDINSIVAWLRSNDPRLAADPTPNRDSEWTFLAKVLAHVAFLPKELPATPVVAPPITDKVAHGRYLATGVVDCYGCHSADFKTMNTDEPEKSERFFGGGNPMTDQKGNVVRTANITPDKGTGIGSWTEEQFIRAVRDGVRPDNVVLRYPMPRYSELSNEELSAIYAYLRTVPAIAYKVDRARPLVATTATLSGAQIYEKYACFTCHGNDGNGLYDLRGAHAKHPADSTLIAWIRDASKSNPETKMPSFDGVIGEHEYAPLVKYVRELGMKKSPTVATR